MTAVSQDPLPEATHGGDRRELARRAGLQPEHLLDVSANLNPLGPPRWLPHVIADAVGELAHYPDPAATPLVEAVAACYGVPGSRVVVGNGSSDILWALPRAVAARRAVVAAPAYTDYARSAALAGLTVTYVTARAEDGFRLHVPELAEALRPDDLVYVGQPANPTGVACDPAELRALAESNAGSLFLVDEAFAAFVEGLESMANAGLPNVVVLLSLTKLFAVPGLRLGAAVAPADLARRVRDQVPPWSVNTIAQVVGARALRDQDYVRHTVTAVAILRERLGRGLQRLSGLTVFLGRANYVLVRLDLPGRDARWLAARLLQEGVAIRVCDDYQGLDARYFRVAVRTERENRRVLVALERVLAGGGVEQA